MELFDVIPENFFSILSSKNKKLYSACAIQAFDVYEQGSILGIERKIVVDDLINFLEFNPHLLNMENEEFNNENEKPTNIREVVNYVVRKLEECGWIYIDVTSNYIEILNFTDYAITIIESLKMIIPASKYVEAEDDYVNVFNQNEYHGYIYTIYSLLNNINNDDYAVVVSQVYKNTKLLIRSLRKIDSRMKEYINSVVENSEIKDLMDKLVNYNEELFDANYSKLKTSDNINKYQLFIVNNLESIQLDPMIMEQVISDYARRYTPDEATKRAYRDIDEMIDIFKSFEDYISEIDEKNKTYINSTIGKIKFLLSEEDNIIGKLNTILKFVKVSYENKKLDKALDKVRSMYTLSSIKGYNNNSLYTPRGRYAKNKQIEIDTETLDIGDLDEIFFNQYRIRYDERYVADFINNNLSSNSIVASEVLNYDSSDDEVLSILYALIYASDHKLQFKKLDDIIDHRKFTMRNFMLIKEGDK